MPYALRPPLVDGEYVVADFFGNPAAIPAGRVVLSEAEWESKQFWVWSSATQALRQPTAADLLRFAKRDKEKQIRDAADAQFSADLRYSEGIEVRGRKAEVGYAALTVDEKAIQDQIDAINTKRRTLVAQVRAATTDTVAKVQAIAW